MELLKIIYDGKTGIEIIIDPYLLSKINEQQQNDISEKVREIIKISQDALNG